jgi:predicted ArsR family transcriptional regulator
MALLPKGKTTFRNLQKTTGISPRIMRRYLDELINKKLVYEEGRKAWKRGKQLRYSLTAKGQQECVRAALENVNKSLEVVNTITSHMLSTPQALAARREEARHAVHTIAASDSLPLEEKIRKTMRIRDVYFGTFRQSLRKMHLIAVKLFAPPSANMAGNMYLLINENGVINAVKEDEILMHPNISVISG